LTVRRVGVAGPEGRASRSGAAERPGGARRLGYERRAENQQGDLRSAVAAGSETRAELRSETRAEREKLVYCAK
jgi:hypothetical protein